MWGHKSTPRAWLRGNEARESSLGLEQLVNKVKPTCQSGELSYIVEDAQMMVVAIVAMIMMILIAASTGQHLRRTCPVLST